MFTCQQQQHVCSPRAWSSHKAVAAVPARQPCPWRTEGRPLSLLTLNLTVQGTGSRILVCGESNAETVGCWSVTENIGSFRVDHREFSLLITFLGLQILSPLGRINEAVNDLTKAIQLQPSARLYRHRGTLYFLSEVRSLCPETLPFSMMIIGLSFPSALGKSRLGAVQ